VADPVEQRERLGLTGGELQDFETELLGLAGIVLAMQLDRALDDRRQRPCGIGRRQQRRVELAAAHRPQPAAAGA